MDLSNILIWNARGLNSNARRDVVRGVVNDCRLDIMCLQETKLAYISNWDAISILGSDFDNFVFLSADETTGGILMACKGHVLEVKAHRVDRHFVSICIKQSEQQSWWLTGVYGP